MDKIKRIIALVGVIILLGLYVGTFLLAIFGNANTLSLLKAAIFSTVVLPALLWIYSYIYKLIKHSQSTEDDESKNKDK